MIDKIIGFIGAGNMGSAMIGGIVHSELVTTSQIIASAHSAATLEKLQSTYSIETTLSNETVAERSDILFLAVKPNKFDEVIPQISSHVKSGCVIVSIATKDGYIVVSPDNKVLAAVEAAHGTAEKRDVSDLAACYGAEYEKTALCHGRDLAYVAAKAAAKEL